MKVRNKNSGKIYQVYGFSSPEFGRYGDFTSKVTRYLIWDFGYKWISIDYFDLI